MMLFNRLLDNRSSLNPFPDEIGHNERLSELIRLRIEKKLPPVDCGIRVECCDRKVLELTQVKEAVKSAHAIVKWLTDNKIDAQYKNFEEVPDGEIFIRVGPKPNPVKR